jgi:hypothetical protein
LRYEGSVANAVRSIGMIDDMMTVMIVKMMVFQMMGTSMLFYVIFLDR